MQTETDGMAVATAHEGAAYSHASSTKYTTFRHGFLGPTPLYNHQVVGVSRLTQHECYGCLDEMGLGKTIQAMYAAADLILGGKLDAVLVVCEAERALNWKQELDTHLPNATYKILTGLKPHERSFDDGVDFYIISYELLARTSVTQNCKRLRSGKDALRIVDLCKRRKVGAILDEAHYIRGPRSKSTRCLFYLRKFFPWRVILTGTLEAEACENVWAPMFFLDGGRALGSSWYAFCDRYCTTSLIRTPYGRVSKITGYKRLKELNAKVRSITVRRTKKQCLDLPPKTYCTTFALAKGAFRTKCYELRDELTEALEEGAVAGPVFGQLMDDWLQHSASVEGPKFEQLLRRMREEGGQAIVWCQHKRIVNDLADALSAEGIAASGITSEVKGQARQDKLDAWRAGDLNTIVATMGTLRTGYTFTHCWYAAYYQPTWSLLDWTQSQDRLHRIGTTGTVVLDRFVLDVALDRYMVEKVMTKDASVRTRDDEFQFSRAGMLNYMGEL